LTQLTADWAWALVVAIKAMAMAANVVPAVLAFTWWLPRIPFDRRDAPRAQRHTMQETTQLYVGTTEIVWIAAVSRSRGFRRCGSDVGAVHRARWKSGHFCIFRNCFSRDDLRKKRRTRNSC
jgi:hypothetical protein